jgi:alpha,alpha-trehalase
VAAALLVFLGPPATPFSPVHVAHRKGGRSFTTQQLTTRVNPSLDDILLYIGSTWDDLTRRASDCKALSDAKTNAGAILYLPAGMALPQDVSDLQKQCNVRVEHLPEKITNVSRTLGGVPADGLLYLPYAYVVPGGQFNEMYGWDSYFIIRGLLVQHRLALAKGMVEDFFFEIENYGKVLNANRTYYLSRSQPPFLSSMVLAVYDAEEAEGSTDSQWLAKAYRFVVRDYEQWNSPPHLAGRTTLSRYYDLKDGPVSEIQNDASNYYHGVAQFFATHGSQYDKYIIPADSNHVPAQITGPAYEVPSCDSGTVQPTETCVNTRVALTADFYKGDRAMRESGFDVTFRFGPFGADTHHYAPVCLNSLLFKTESDLERISSLLGHKDDALQWHRRALARRKKMDQFLWDDDRGLYFDYDFVRGGQSSYEYLTTFYPLWAGLASKRQALLVERNLSLFENPGGLAMSRKETEAQWDYPYGWAPVELLAVEGLRRYGFDADADRVASEFLTTVARNFARDHTIREKYDVVTRSEDTHIDFGYAQNFPGFGWTNGVFLELLNGLSPEARASLERQ